MKLFISFSGERSHLLASALKDWLPHVIHTLKSSRIWLSDRDIQPGKAWGRELSDVLGTAALGLICVTPENLSAPWIHFEAGALSKRVDDRSKVIPFLFGLQPRDVKDGPLGLFQAVTADRDGVLRMLRSLNAELGDGALTDDVLKASFERNWPDLETVLAEIEAVRIDDASMALSEIIQSFSQHGLMENATSRLTHFASGYESHALYNVVAGEAKERLWIFGRKNRKIFDKEHNDFLKALPGKLEGGFDFRCLFLDPDAPDDVIATAHADDDFATQLVNCVKKARDELAALGLQAGRVLRTYRTHRTVNLVICDDAILFAHVQFTPDGRPKGLTKCPFSVVDRRTQLGGQLIQTFLDTWEGAEPLT